MKVSQRIDLIDRLARELQSSYTFDDIDTFLMALSIDLPPGNVGYDSKREYAKFALKRVSDVKLLAVSDELGVNLPSVSPSIVVPPTEWPDATLFRLFISHLAKHKDKATRLKLLLRE